MDTIALGYLKQIVKKLGKWKEARHLTLEMQRAGFVNNFNEEVQEYNFAKNYNEKIDALCDMVVFIINAWEYNEEDLIYVINKVDSYKDTFKRNVKFYNSADIVNSKENSLDQIVFIFLQMLQFKYDPYIAMDETIKEISSRTGKYIEEQKKWIKDTSPEAKARWYKANYDSAKLNYQDQNENYVPRKR